MTARVELPAEVVEAFAHITVAPTAYQRGVHRDTLRAYVERVAGESERLRDALRNLDECYCEVGPDLTQARRMHHRKVLIAARAALHTEEGS